MTRQNESVPEEFVNNLRLALRRERVAQGFSQREVSIAAGVASSSVVAWEMGRTIPSWYHIKRWAEVLGYEIEVSVSLLKASDEGQEALVVEDTPDVPRVMTKRDRE